MNLENKLQTVKLTGPDTSLTKVFTPPVYVLFHHPCSDGFGAKYAAWKKFGDKATYLGVNYGQPLPAIPDGSDVYIIDFSYPKEVLRELLKRSNKLVVLDHHKTAQEALTGEEYAIFDMNRSGAVLAWDYFFPEEPVPTLLAMIQDRDLWQWKIPRSKDVLNYLSVVGDEVSDWDELVPLRGDAYAKGEMISRYQEKLIKSAVGTDRFKVVSFIGYRVVILNATNFASEIGNILCEDSELNLDFSITYFIDRDNVVNLSFRSDKKKGEEDGFDVSEIARSLGGGGHRNAAGARVSLLTLQGWLQNAKPL